MAVTDVFRRIYGSDEPGTADRLTIPSHAETRMKRGRKEMTKNAPKYRLCRKFEKGETFWYLNQDGQLRQQATVTHVGGGGKPRHRVRLSHNFIRPIIEGKISAATQRIPSYEVLPSTTDFERMAGAKLAEKVAIYGYDKWRLRRVAQKVVKNALVTGAGFAYPYFDQNVGPYVPVTDEDTGEQKFVGYGEVKVLTLGPDQVYWEPGVDFEDSPWWVVERARPIDEVMCEQGYLKGNLKPDASIADLPSDKPSENMVLVSEYLERPSSKNPRGLRIISAGGRLIFPPEPYPLQTPKGETVDEPCIHRLVYTHDDENDTDLGLVWQLIDPQRVVQDILNKMSEWKNRCLNPQMIAEEGTLLEERTDEPGANVYYRRGTRNIPQWEQVPPIPDSLFRFHDLMRTNMKEIGADAQVEASPDVAARAIQATIEQSNARWASFIGDEAEWHSRVMRHCLLLVACHYNEPRLLQIRGRSGFEPIPDFKGSNLLDQVDVIVLPGSLEYRTRAQIKQDVFAYADRGWISPEQAMAAIDGGNAEKLIQSYELDVARANRVIQKIRDGSVMEMAPKTRTDPATGMPMMDPMTGQPLEIPGYMPSEWDNLKVWRSVFGDWMKTDEYDQQIPPEMQEVGKQIWEGLQTLEVEAQMAAVAAQNAAAEQQGMANAARPVGGKDMPSMPGGGPAPGGDGSPTAQPPPGS